MAELYPYSFGSLITRMFREYEEKDSIYDLPARKFVLGDEILDYSVDFHGASVSTPLGPAAGPQSQMAQNLVLSWLVGCRVMELKTVQIMDELRIPRPCIDMQTVGYNVEWSQELKLEASLEEYVKGSMLIEMLAASGILKMKPGFEKTIFDMSVGYDLEGIKSPTVQAFIKGMLNASDVVDRLRAQIPEEYAEFRDLDYTTRLSDTLTLSTFHGCPPDEIERIMEFLLEENGLHSIVKLNPMLLGRDDTHQLLVKDMGYRDIKVPDSAFERDTTWDQAMGFVQRLGDKAEKLNLGFGVKFTNTLIVQNNRRFFPETEKEMYLSGPPLHVLAMELVGRFRKEFGAKYPISFSAGIDRQNFPDSVALGIVPVTVCSDLLKVGGYARAFGYFKDLNKRMKKVGATNIPEFVVRAFGKGAEGLEAIGVDNEHPKRSAADEALSNGGDLGQVLGEELHRQLLDACSLLNTEEYCDGLSLNPRYSKTRNSKLPRKIDSHLELFDCVTCDICVPVCPNDANFTFPVPAMEIPIIKVQRQGSGWTAREEGTLNIEKKHQIGNFSDFCNDCGNCDIFCPEEGGPYILKGRFFGSKDAWRTHRDLDGFFFEGAGDESVIRARFEGREYRVQRAQGRVNFRGYGFSVNFDPVDPVGTMSGNASGEFDLTYFRIMEIIQQSIFADGETNYVAMLQSS